MRLARSGRLTTSVALLTALPSLAWAHPGFGHSDGFMQGLAHPVSGLDHGLAMLAAGLLAGKLGGAALWRVPASFVAMTACGILLGRTGAPLPLVETGIALSIIVLGSLLAAGRTIAPTLAMAIVGCFAVFHGHAHGTEAAAGLPGTAYSAGLLSATALLHACGAIVATVLMRTLGPQGTSALRLGGSAIAVAGIGVFAGLL